MSYLWDRAPLPQCLTGRGSGSLSTTPKTKNAGSHHRGQGKVMRGGFTPQGQLANGEHHLLFSPEKQAATPQGQRGDCIHPLTKIEAG